MNKTSWSRPYFGMAFAESVASDAPPPPPPTGGTPAANAQGALLKLAA